ncbi:MAG: Permease of the drug/metabolite transporter (DMT) superfamily/Uncharacterized membrane protein [Chloroflexi bacterium]|nr:MAG: Permease of the drug/metabolite transporter (DMT) superfamily/Uncharacterized membrane protein [Chloroflexota bacterium]
MLGPILGVLSAAGFALSNVFARRGVLGVPALQGIYVTVIAGVPLFVILAAATGQLFRLGDLTWEQNALLASSGLTQYIIGRYSGYRSIGALGANGSAPLLSLSALVAAGMGVLVLGEQMTVLKGVGVVLLILAPLLMLRRPEKKPSPTPATPPVTQPGGGGTPPGTSAVQTTGFTRRQAEGYFFGIIMALGYGGSAVLVRSAIGGTDLAIGGALISYLAAAAVLLVILAIPGWSLNMRSMPRNSMIWFVFGTLSSFSSHTLRFLALGLAPVSVVIPIGQTQSAFVVIFSLAINRSTEIFNFRTIFAIGLSIVGAVILVLKI